MQDRILPQNIEAEQAVIGAMLMDRDAIIKASEILVADDFYREAHKVIFNTILEIFNNNKAADLVTVTDLLKRINKLDDVGGIAYLSSLLGAVLTAANVTYHAEIVAEKSTLRRIINKKKKTDYKFIGGILLDTVSNIEKLVHNKAGLTGIPTGYDDLDKLTGGLHPSDFIILAARPSMGKTALALNIVQNVALRAHLKIGGEPRTVAFFSLEMSEEQLVSRMICAEANIDSQKMRIGVMSDRDWDNLWVACDTMNKAKIIIDDTPGITVMDMRSRARRMKAEHGLDLIVVDYLQLMQGSGKKNSSADRQQEVSEISRSLKALARELDVPVLALSQLSRSVESRSVKRPMLSDLRESGSLEQDADIVAFLYREDYYNPETENKHTELIIAKHRNGPVDTVNLFFQKQFTKFVGFTKRDK